MTPSEQALWERWVEGRDAEAFAEIVSRYSGLVYGTCRRILGNTADAEDATQECFLRLVQGKPGIHSSLPGWLHAAATTTSLNFIRSQARRRGREERHGEMVQTDTESKWSEIEPRVDAAIGDLPEDLRGPLIEHYLGGRTHDDIATSLGLSRSAVTLRIGRAIEEVRKTLRRKGLFVTAVALSTMLAEHGAVGAPVALAATLGKQAIAGLGGAPTASILAPGAKLGGLLVGLKAKVAILVVCAALVSWWVSPRIHGPRSPSLLISPSLSTAMDDARPFEARVAPAVASAALPLASASAELAISGATIEVVVPASMLNSAATGPVAATSEVEASTAADRLPGASESVLMGFVLTRDGGMPIPGATVSQYVDSTSVEVHTNGQGIYRLYTRPSAQARIVVSAEGYAVDAHTVALAAGTEHRLDIYLEQGAELDVRVIDNATQPIKGAEIRRPPGNAHIFTDKDGRVHLTGLNRHSNEYLYAFKEGYESSERVRVQDALLTAPDGEITLRMQHRKAGWFAGRVTNSAGAPIEGVSVTSMWNPAGDRVDAGAGTDTQGRYRLSIDRASSNTVLGAAKPGWAPDTKSAPKPGTEQNPTVVDFVLQPSHWLTGTVVDEKGQPIAQVQIAVFLADLNWVVVPSGQDSHTTDEEGRFRIDDLPGPEVQLTLTCEGYSGKGIKVKVDEDARIVMKSSGVIVGQVLDDATDKPVSGFRAALYQAKADYLGSSQTFPDDDGRFAFHNLSPGVEWQVVVEAAGYTTAHSPTVRSVLEAEAQPVVIRLARENRLTLRITTPDQSAPVAGAQVVYGILQKTGDPSSNIILWDRLMDQESVGAHPILDPRMAISGPDGTVAFDESQPPGTLLIHAQGYAPTILSPQERATYPATQDGVITVPLSPGGALSGVLFEHGFPAPGRRVALTWEDERMPGMLGRFGTDGEGRYLANALPAGPMELHTEARGDVPSLTKRVTLKAGERRRVDLGNDLGPLTLSGRVLDRDSKGLRNTRIRFQPEDRVAYSMLLCFADAAGHYAIAGLQPGTYSIFLEYSGPTGTSVEHLVVKLDIRESTTHDFVLMAANN